MRINPFQISDWESSTLKRQAGELSKAEFPDTPQQLNTHRQLQFEAGYINFYRMKKQSKVHSDAFLAGQRRAWQDMTVNPLGYYCPPNGATPDYISVGLNNFVAYGLMLSHYVLQDMEGYTPTDSDYYELRKNFLKACERMLEAFPDMEIDKRYDDDPGSDYTLFFTSDADRKRWLEEVDNVEPENEFTFNWSIEKRSNDAVCMSIGWNFNGTANHVEHDSIAIWVNADQFKGHKGEWNKVIKQAYKLNEWLKHQP